MNQASKIAMFVVSVTLSLAAVGAFLWNSEVDRAPDTSRGLWGQLAVFHAPKAVKKPRSVDGRPEFVKLRTVSTKKYALPTPDQLAKGRGMTDAEKTALSSGEEVTVLDVELTGDAMNRWHQAEQFALKLAKEAGGAVWDEESLEVMSASWFQTNRVEDWVDGTPSAATHIMFFVEEQSDGTLSLTSGGLAHFDLPELKAVGMGRSGLSSTNAMLNALAQQLVENPKQAKPGKVTLSLEELKHPGVKLWQLESCKENAERKLELVLARSGDVAMLNVELEGSGEPSERFQHALNVLYGSEDEVQHLEHDEALLQESKRAIAVLKKSIKPRFDKGLKLGEMLLVKAPFETSSGGNEWMWVEVTGWKKGGEIVGLLDNDPEDVPELTSGSKVTVKEADLFDWTFKELDGGWSGNTTGAMMTARLKK